MSKKDSRLVKSCDEFKGVLTWNFNSYKGSDAHGDPVTINPEPLEFNVGPVYDELVKLHPIAARAMMHGYKQKISDAGAMARDTETGLADNAARVEKMRRMAETLANGQWELERTGGGAGPGVLARAVAEAMGKDLDVVREWLKGKSVAERTALRNDPKILPIVQRMEAEAASDIDTEDLLAGLK